MGQDGNTIEIEIDAAATQAAAKTAGEANAKLEEFNNALKLFRDNVGTISKTTDSVASKIGDFNTLLQTFSDKLTENLANMQTSVVAKIEPHLERELENLVNRVTNKVEAKFQPEKQSRSRSEAKQGAGAVPTTVPTTGERIRVEQPDEKRPDYKIFENVEERVVAEFDETTGKMVNRIVSVLKTKTVKTEFDKYEDEEGNTVHKTRTTTTYANAVNKSNEVLAEATKVEKDRGLAIRKEITGALIGLHVMKVVSQYSSVANAGFQMVAAAMGHLLNNILLPMMPAFVIFAQVLHSVANLVAMLPMPMRQLLGALLMWKGISMLVASMPLKDIKDGFAGIREVMQGADSGIKKFWALLRAFVDFMNSGQGRGAVGSLVAGGKAVGGRIKGLIGRASGGPVLGHGAYIVGEKGPELFVPKTNGTIIPNHKIGRAEGGDVISVGGAMPEPSTPLGGDVFSSFSAGLGINNINPAGIADVVAGAVSSDIGQNIIGTVNTLTGMLSAILAPLAPILGVVSGVMGIVSGMRGGGGGDHTAETVAKVGTEQIKATGKMSFGIQNVQNAVGRGTSKLLTAILLRLGVGIPLLGLPKLGFGELLDAIKDFIKGIKEFLERLKEKFGKFIDELSRLWEELKTKLEDAWKKLKDKFTEAWKSLKDTLDRAWKDLKDRLSEAWKSLKDTLDKAWRDLTDKLSDAWKGFKDALDNAWREFKRVADESWKKLGDIFGEAWKKLGDILRGAWDSLKRVWDEGWRGLGEKLTEAWNGLKRALVDKWAELKDTLDTAWRDLKDKLTDSWREIKSKFTEAWAGLKDTLDTAWRDLKDKLGESWKELKAKITGIIEYIELGKEALKNIDPLKIKEAFVEKISVLPEKVTDFITRLRELFTGQKVEIKPEVPEGTTAGDIVKKIKWNEGLAGPLAIFWFAFMDASEEYLKTGTIDWGPFFLRQAALIIASGVLLAVATAVGGSLFALFIAAIGTAVATHDWKVTVSPIIQKMIDGFTGNTLLGNIFDRIFKNEDNTILGATFGPVMGGVLRGIVDTAFDILAQMDMGAKLKEAMEKAGLGNMLAIGQNLAIILNPSTDLTTKLEAFNNMFKQTVSGGIPVDVKMDVDSVTSVVNAVRETAMGTPISGGASVPGETVQECPTGSYWDRALQACAPIQGSVIPSHASGGFVTPGIPNLVGERGPELFVPSGPGEIIPNSKLGSLGGGGSITNNVTIHVTTNNPKELTDTVMKQLKLELARVKM